MPIALQEVNGRGRAQGKVDAYILQPTRLPKLPSDASPQSRQEGRADRLMAPSQNLQSQHIRRVNKGLGVQGPHYIIAKIPQRLADRRRRLQRTR